MRGGMLRDIFGARERGAAAPRPGTIAQRMDFRLLYGSDTFFTGNDILQLFRCSDKCFIILGQPN